MTITVVSPHRGDAAFSLGLSIEGWLGAGHAVSVLNCFTKSEYAPYSDAETLHANDRLSFVSAVRRREDLAWNKLLGGPLQMHDLDLLDAPLRLACAVEDVLTVEVRPGDRALARVTGAISKLVRNTPELLLVAPLAIGNHIDGRVVRQAVLDSVRGTNVPVAFYEDLPYAARDRAAEGMENVAVALEADLQPVYMQPQNHDATAVLARKRRMADCYDSQTDTEVANALAQFSERYLGRERLWVNPAGFAAGEKLSPWSLS